MFDGVGSGLKVSWIRRDLGLRMGGLGFRAGIIQSVCRDIERWCINLDVYWICRRPMLRFGFLGFRGDSGEVCDLGPRLQGLWKRTSTNERDATVHSRSTSPRPRSQVLHLLSERKEPPKPTLRLLGASYAPNPRYWILNVLVLQI